MKLILQNGQQFYSFTISAGALTSVYVSPPVDFLRGNIARGRKERKRKSEEGAGRMRGTPRFSIYGLSDATRFPFSSDGGILQAGGNVKRKFESLEINSGPARLCGAHAS